MMDFNFEKRVRELASAKGMSLAEVDNKAGLPLNSVFQTFRHGNPKINTVARYAMVFNMSFLDFVGKR